MAAASHVNTILTTIHNLVSVSGLHFVINTTPFSSYITIRKKLVNAENVPPIESVKPSANKEPSEHELANLKDNQE